MRETLDLRELQGRSLWARRRHLAKILEVKTAAYKIVGLSNARIGTRVVWRTHAKGDLVAKAILLRGFGIYFRVTFDVSGEETFDQGADKSRKDVKQVTCAMNVEGRNYNSGSFV